VTEPTELVVGIPEKVETRSRLGPFASGQDALKFVGYAAVGGILAVALGPVWWLPFLGVGTIVTVPPWKGAAPDRRLVTYLRWRWHSASAMADSPSPTPLVRSNEKVIEVLPDRFAAVVVGNGAPLAFLPSAERKNAFEEYRTLLRATDPGAFVTVGVEPLPTRPYLPPRPSVRCSSAELGAERGYEELVRFLCRRRFRRRVRWVVWSPGADLRRLELRVQAIQDALGRLGIRAERLAGRELARQLRTIGWSSKP